MRSAIKRLRVQYFLYDAMELSECCIATILWTHKLYFFIPCVNALFAPDILTFLALERLDYDHEAKLAAEEFQLFDIAGLGGLIEVDMLIQ